MGTTTRKLNGWAILKEFDAKHWGDVYRALYKGTGCGVTIGASFAGLTKPVYNGALSQHGPDSEVIALYVSSIVEGCEETTSTRTINLDEPGDAVARLYQACTEVEKEAAAIWNETHGCESCAMHFGIDHENERSPVWDDCPRCEGSGIVI